MDEIKAQANQAVPSAIDQKRPKSCRAQIAQSLFTLCTLVFAIYVYANWSTQELARRRADFSIEALRTARELTGCLERNRLTLISEVDRSALEKLLEQHVRNLRECETLEHKLGTLQPLSRTILGDAASTVIAEINETIRSMRSAIGGAQSSISSHAWKNYVPGSHPKVLADTIDELRRQTLVKVIELSVPPVPFDEVSKRLRDYRDYLDIDRKMNALEIELLRHIHFR